VIVTNQTTADIYFGPLHLGAGVGTMLTVDDTSDTSLYLTNDSVADALNNAYSSGNITVSGEAQPFPRPIGTPTILHGDGSPEGLVYASQGSVYLNRSAGSSINAIYTKTTGLHLSTGWVAMAGASPGLTGVIAASGSISGGSGFTVNKTATGTYAVTFNAAFVSVPVVTLAVEQSSTDVANGRSAWITLETGSVGTTGFTAYTGSDSAGPAYADRDWYFLAIAVV
jgi:hypothetical protein